MLIYSEVATEAGRLRVVCSSKGIAMVCSARGTRTAFENSCQKQVGSRPGYGEIPASYKQAVIKAASGRDFAPVPVDLSGLPKFQQKVLKALQQVPRGEVRTYGWLARKAGRPAAARAVGNTMARNPIPFLIPCHRIVPSSGALTAWACS